jgi:uncharacterized membrane protein YhaH (DUF805 family)
MENKTLLYLYVSVLLTAVAMLLLSIIYSKKKGPNTVNEKISFYHPILFSAVLCYLVYLSPFSWIFLLLNIIVIIIINITSFYALEKAMTDKTGMGVTMFSGFVCILLLGFFTLLKILTA